MNRPTDQLPQCCKSGFQTLHLEASNLKTLQNKMAGSWEHQDIYSPARTRTEWYFARLMDPDCGNLTLGKVEFNKNSFVALAITATIIVTNLRIIEKFEEDRRSNDGVPPRETGQRRLARRQHLAAA